MIRISITVKGIKEIAGILGKLPNGGPAVVLAAFVNFMMTKIKPYPGYKYVSRRAAYGKSFFSDRQRRYVMAMIRSGAINPGFPQRTGELQRGWTIANTSGAKTYITNRVPYSKYVMGSGQARQPKLVGWKIAYDIIMANYKAGAMYAKKALLAWLGWK